LLNVAVPKVITPPTLEPDASTLPLSLFISCQEVILPSDPDASTITAELSVTGEAHLTDIRPVDPEGDHEVLKLPSFTFP